MPLLFHTRGQINKLTNLILVFSLLPGCAAADQQPAPVRSYSECVQAGNPIARSYPASCRTSDGLIFFEEPQRPLIDRARKLPGSICTNGCGNGQCEEIVCMGAGCPCAETPQTCPADCPAGQNQP